MPAVGTCCSPRPSTPSSAERLAEPRGISVEIVVAASGGRDAGRPRSCRRSVPSAGRSWSTRAARPVDRRASCTPTDSLAAQIDGLVERGRGRPTTGSCSCCRCTTSTASSTSCLCALAVGASCEAPGGFDPVQMWERLRRASVTLFMAVPTDLQPSVAAWERRRRGDAGALVGGRGRAPPHGVGVGGAAGVDARAVARDHRARAARALRHDRDRHGPVEHARRAGCRATSASRSPASRCASSTTPATTSPTVSRASSSSAARSSSASTGAGPTPPRAAFADGWFRTGDVAVRRARRLPHPGSLVGRHHQVGRREVSALEIEEVLPHPPRRRRLRRGRRGRPRVGRAGVRRRRARPAVATLDRRCAARLGEGAAGAVYKVPSRFVFVDDLPRNAMGKVTKPGVSEPVREPLSSRRIRMPWPPSPEEPSYPELRPATWVLLFLD